MFAFDPRGKAHQFALRSVVVIQRAELNGSRARSSWLIFVSQGAFNVYPLAISPYSEVSLTPIPYRTLLIQSNIHEESDDMVLFATPRAHTKQFCES